MTDDESTRQWKIANEVLGYLFAGPVRLSLSGEMAKIEVSGQLRIDRLGSAIAALMKRTGQGKDVDPFKQPDGNAWVITSQILSQANVKPIALDVAKTYLAVCYELQEATTQRIHKGAPLFWIGQRLLELGEFEPARGYLLLAFVEDIRVYKNPLEAPAFQILVGSLGFPSETIEDLMNYARSHPDDFPFYPEAALVGWELQHTPPPEPVARGA